ncbi:hypothetical protein EZJ55_06695 [Microcystis aeruginosa EAWAG127a]|uniref:Uncharacterized protein n=1 Tax=Microcystis aeruginosa EAWAG127a TaxID=2529855 RepID=A0A5J5LRF7_MICAE|nr:hypothetical protein [Microcystis aeruginosa]KAB0240324.1 hypothetical protein EZJ55_06695 [Microcystis aeruginosa EAWAG127a]
MRQKRNFWQKLAILLTTTLATLFGYGQSKVLSIEAKAASRLDVQERLDQVREQLELHKQELNSQDYGSDSPNKPIDNLEEQSEQRLAQWGDWYNGWRNWANWGNY